MNKNLTLISIIILGLSLAILPVAAGAASTNTLPTSCQGLTLTDDLALGSTSKSVTCLQALLNQNTDTMVASTGPGSAGNETNYFGSLTKKAVMAFQLKNASTILTPAGIKTGTGIVGPRTRDALNKIIAIEGGTTSPTNPQ